MARRIILSPKSVDQSARRKVCTVPGFRAEFIRVSEPRDLEFSYKNGSALLSLNNFVRLDGETQISSGPRSTLKDARNRLTFIPPHSEVRGWSRFSRPSASYLVVYFDPTNELDVCDLTKINPKVHFQDIRLRATMEKFREVLVGHEEGSDAHLTHAYEMNVVGIEASASHVATSQLLAECSGLNRATFKVADAETYVDPEAFDLVVHFGTLYHLRNPIRALEAASRNLKVGGVLALETQCHGEPGGMTARYVRGFNGDPSNWWALGDGSLRAILTFCGFGEPIEVLHWTHPLLDGMYRIIWVMRKLYPIEQTYEDRAGSSLVQGFI